MAKESQLDAQPQLTAYAHENDGFPLTVEQTESPGEMISYNQRDREKLVVSVLEGLEGGIVDQQMADKWVQNEDDFCPQVIADDSEDEVSGSSCLGELNNVD